MLGDTTTPPPDPPAPPDQITLYGHNVCPMLPTTVALLKRASVDYTYINIHQNDAARQRVREINNGYESVPTLEFPDGTTLTEPSAYRLKRKLETLGYHVPFTAVLLGNAQWILVGIAILIAILSALGVF